MASTLEETRMVGGRRGPSTVRRRDGDRQGGRRVAAYLDAKAAWRKLARGAGNAKQRLTALPRAIDLRVVLGIGELRRHRVPEPTRDAAPPDSGAMRRVARDTSGGPCCPVAAVGARRRLASRSSMPSGCVAEPHPMRGRNRRIRARRGSDRAIALGATSQPGGLVTTRRVAPDDGAGNSHDGSSAQARPHGCFNVTSLADPRSRMNRSPAARVLRALDLDPKCGRGRRNVDGTGHRAPRAQKTCVTRRSTRVPAPPTGVANVAEWRRSRVDPETYRQPRRKRARSPLARATSTPRASRCCVALPEHDRHAKRGSPRKARAAHRIEEFMLQVENAGADSPNQLGLAWSREFLLRERDRYDGVPWRTGHT